MLKSLQIKDYVLIDNSYIEFGKGLNIITGETGAGKSIILDAMGLILGERASSDVVRKGAEKSIIEAIFGIEGNPKVQELLKANEIEGDGELIVRREISLKGTSRTFLNDTPVTLNLLKEAGYLLVDLHGQHEHQSLLRSETHCEALDEFGDIDPLAAGFKSEASKLNHLVSELKSLREKESIIKEKQELYKYQIAEIDKIAPEEREEEHLKNELNILENSEKLIELANSAYQKLYESDSSIYGALGEVKDEIQQLNNIDKSLTECSEEMASALALINDITSYLRSYKDKIEFDPERLEEIRERLGAFSILKKKYGGSITSVLEYRKRIGEEFNLAENFSEKISGLESQITEQRKAAGSIAKKISKARKETAVKIQGDIEQALSQLGMPNSKFVVKINNRPAEHNDAAFILVDNAPYRYNHRGYDDVEFYISANLGEDPKPLAKTASGGEISRIMLALKSVLAKKISLPILIFDEIDTGVSGRIAQKVGQTIKSLASFHMIIAITHLPQIAGLADEHFAVEKKEEDNRSSSSIRKLTREERIREVAKLISGENVTEASLKGARELMGI
ncbi:MAG TPA: DNA repair protein RecN [Ignavibacteriales bacterium]|nr:DNA repair protein RecN [Ignavibacteriales bacterium]